MTAEPVRGPTLPAMDKPQNKKGRRHKPAAFFVL